MKRRLIQSESQNNQGSKLFFIRGILGLLVILSFVGCGGTEPVKAPALAAGSKVIMDGSTKSCAIGVGLLKTTLAKPVRKL